MSAFVCQDETINKVVTYIKQDRYAQHLWKRLHEECGIETPEQLGRAMFNLNCVAVNARYGPGQAEQFRDLAYHYRPYPARAIEAYKALRCWHYQCAEGEAPASPLYRIMECYAGEIAHDIIVRLPEYDRAAWD